MQREHKTAIVRIFTDLIEADRIIDAGEMRCWQKMRSKYAIDDATVCEAQGVTLAEAVNGLSRNASNELRHEILADCHEMAVADGFCALSEALLVNMLSIMLGDSWVPNSQVVSAPLSPLFYIDPGTALFIESGFDGATNKALRDNFRALFQEFQLAGMHFIYIPQVIDHYRETDPEHMRQIMAFIAPRLASATIETVRRSLLAMTTAWFCKNLLCNKMGLENLRNVEPSLLIKVGNSKVSQQNYGNHLCMPVGPDVLQTVQTQLDQMSSLLTGDIAVVRTSKERNAQFLHSSFYKPLMDIFLAPTDIRSRIVIDPFKGEISFPDVQQSLLGLSRREKALYVLFLCQGPRGLNFKPPRTASQLAAHNRRMERTQQQYKRIYCRFGGDRNAVPDLTNPEIRRPSVSRLKAALKQINGLYNAADYAVSKSPDGTLSVNVESSLVQCVELGSSHPVPLASSALLAELG